MPPVHHRRSQPYSTARFGTPSRRSTGFTIETRSSRLEALPTISHSTSHHTPANKIITQPSWSNKSISGTPNHSLKSAGYGLQIVHNAESLPPLNQHKKEGAFNDASIFLNTTLVLEI